MTISLTVTLNTPFIILTSYNHQIKVWQQLQSSPSLSYIKSFPLSDYQSTLDIHIPSSHHQVMRKKKLIQNYQLVQLHDPSPFPYQCYTARHVNENKPYTIKKLKLKSDPHSILQQKFLHESAILKHLKHPNIAKPLKMLKTSTTIYIVYQHYQNLSLQQFIQTDSNSKSNKNKITLLEKQSLIKQLFSVLHQLHKSAIAHLCLSPQCIFVNQNNDIKVTHFLHAIHLPDNNQQIELQYEQSEDNLYNIPLSTFTPPQIKKHKASSLSDVYSFGKIIQYLDLPSSKKGTLTNKQFQKKVQLYTQIAKKTTRRKPYQRLSIQQLYQQYFAPKSKLKKLASMSMSSSKVGLNTRQSIISRSNSVTSYGGNSKTALFIEEVLLTLIKRHNMAKFLIEIIKNITICEQHPRPEEIIMLSTLLLKKSTLILNSLGKFMKYAKGIPTLQLNEKQRNRLFKSGDFIKLQPIIESQVKQQRRLYESAIEGIFMDNVKLMQNKPFSQQLKKQQIDEAFFMQLINKLITTSINEISLQQQHSNYLKTIYLLSLIVDCGGVEKFFQKKITPRPIQLNEQSVFVKVNQMSIPQFIQLLKSKQNGSEDKKS